jgi:hypothetical protein
MGHRLNHLAGIVIMLLMSLGCSSVPWKQVGDTPWSRPSDGVGVTRKGLIIGADRFSLPSPQSRLVGILGEPDRVEELANRILVWDKLGIFAYVDPGEAIVHAVSVCFACDSMSYCPAQRYAGVVVIGNAAFRTVPLSAELERAGFDRDDLFWLKNRGRYTISIEVDNSGLGMGEFEIDK